MAPNGLGEVSLTDMADIGRKYMIPIAAVGVAGIGFFALRKYFGGGVCRSKVRLEGKTVIITGANTGIGKETAKNLAKRGARVILACRDTTKALRAAEEIRKETGNAAVEVKIVDLASLESVRRFCQDVKESEERLDILINNAGIMACPKWKSTDGYEMQFAVNHLGHFLLTNELLELLKKSTPSRIVNLSSTAHKKGKINFDDINLDQQDVYTPWRAYGQSKLANILFTSELSKRLEGTGVTTYSLHPGVILTELSRFIAQTMPLWRRCLWRTLSLFALKNPEQGAQTTLYCAVTEGIEKDSGKYFSDCAVEEPAPQAKDEEVAKKLWEVSTKLVGL